eukprot:symbB.v1.2.020909.t1/scaffold1784.1/size101483/5
MCFYSCKQNRTWTALHPRHLNGRWKALQSTHVSEVIVLRSFAWHRTTVMSIWDTILGQDSIPCFGSSRNMIFLWVAVQIVLSRVVIMASFIAVMTFIP